MYVCLISHSYASLVNEKEWFTFITYPSCRVQSASRGLNQKGMRENGWQVAPLSRFVGLSLILQKLRPSSFEYTTLLLVVNIYSDPPSAQIQPTPYCYIRYICHYSVTPGQIGDRVTPRVVPHSLLCFPKGKRIAPLRMQ